MNKNKKCVSCANNSTYGAYGAMFCSICENGDMYKERQQTKRVDYASYVQAHAIAEKYNPKSTLPITNVIFAPPATIVFWNDGTKSVVKCENEVYDPEKGLAMAIAKRALGNKGNYFETFKKWVDPYVEKQKDVKVEAKHWFIWYRAEDGAVCVTGKEYKRKCDASRVTNKLNSLDLGIEYVAAQENPWAEN